MRNSSNILELRETLAAVFPRSFQKAPASRSAQVQSTGVALLDALAGGGLSCGVMTELVGWSSGAGSAQVVCSLLEGIAGEGRFMALVDGMDSFDTSTMEPEALARLLWVRCSTTADALKACDLLLRDRNHCLVVLDLKLNPAKELRRISSSTWFRYKRLLEENGATFLVVTPFPLVSGAACRIELKSESGMLAATASCAEFLSQLKVSVTRSALGGGLLSAAQTG